MPDQNPTGGATQARNPETGQFTSIRDAATALESLMTLDPIEDNQDGTEATEEAPEAQAEEDLEEGTQDEGTEAEEAEESEDEEPGSDEGEEPEQAPRTRNFTVRVDGKEEQVSESELIAGYSRQSDYTRKTQALATERKQFEQDLNQARQERAEYAQLLPQLRKALEQGVSEPNWAALRADDAKNGTARFANEWAAWQQHKQQLEAVRSEENRVKQQQSKEAEAARAARLGQEREALLRAVPAWKDPKVAKSDSEAIAATMRSVGYEDDDIAVHDHRALQIALKAARYDQLMAKQPQLRQKMRQAPVVKPGGGTPNPAGAGVKQARDRFNQSGSVKDAASLLERLL